MFPYKCLMFPGNYSELVYKVLKPRGFSTIIREKQNIDVCNFIWNPIDFSRKVQLLCTTSYIKKLI